MTITTSGPILTGTDAPTYSDLQSLVLDWMARGDLTGNVTDFIRLAEYRLNRLIGAVETDASLTGTVDERSIDVTEWSVVEPIELYILDTSTGDERRILKRTAGNITHLETSGEPREWAWDSDGITFDRPLDAEYEFRLRFKQRFQLSDDNNTNWLLTNHMDVYLAASIMWGGGFIQNYPFAAMFKSMLDEGIAEIQSQIARSKVGLLVVDSALRSRGSSYNWTTDE